MNLEVLISTMNVSSKEDFSKGFIWLQNKGIPIVMINQCISIKPNLFVSKKDLKIISKLESGLSKSRNQALIHATKNICHISDDDLEYVPDFNLIIESTYLKNPKADIIVFQIKTNENKKYKDYNKKQKWLGLRGVAKVSSVEITFKRKSIMDNKITFDENFGLGTDLPSGEEFIFLSDAIKKGLKVLYVPKQIVFHPMDSSGKVLNNKKLIEAKGAMFYRVFGFRSYFISIIFSLKKYNHSNIKLLTFIKYMFNGIKKTIN